MSPISPIAIAAKKVFGDALTVPKNIVATDQNLPRDKVQVALQLKLPVDHLSIHEKFGLAPHSMKTLLPQEIIGRHEDNLLYYRADWNAIIEAAERASNAEKLRRVEKPVQSEEPSSAHGKQRKVRVTQTYNNTGF